MDHELTRYLDDHLLGSTRTLLLIGEIADKHDVPEAREYFRDLQEKVAEDRSLLEEVLRQIQRSPNVILKPATGVAGRVAGLKAMWEIIEPGQLGMFDALEMLAIGFQSKRLLWEMLARIAPHFPEWRDLDFFHFAREAVSQRDGVEFWRVEAGAHSLVPAKRSPTLNRVAPRRT